MNQGVDGDTMAADTGAGLQDVNPRVAVGEINGIPNVDVHFVGDQGQFVGKGDVDVAKGVFRQLDQFRRRRRGQVAFAFDGDFVQRRRASGAGLAKAADDPVVAHQFQQHPARQHSFRAMGDVDLGVVTHLMGKAQVGPVIG